MLTREFVIPAPHGAPVRVGGAAPLLVIAGPCVIESADMALQTAARLRDICRALDLGFVFKSSYLKDNRSSVRAAVGPGPQAGLRVLARVRDELGVPVLSDIHERAEIAAAQQVLDVLQIPAFLCRQTRLIQDAAATGKCINVKKGQFLSPQDVRHIVEKYEATGSGGLMLTERGTSFGYNNLVVDMRGLQAMRELGYPVVFDITHSLQQPGGAGEETGGERRYAATLSRAAVAAGVDAVFLEAHPEPARAHSDRHTQLPLDSVAELLRVVREFHRLHRELLAEVAGAGGI